MADKDFPIKITDAMKANFGDAKPIRDMPSRAEIQEIANEVEELTGDYVEVSYNTAAFPTGERTCFWSVRHGGTKQHFGRWPDLVEWVERRRSMLRKKVVSIGGRGSQ